MAIETVGSFNNLLNSDLLMLSSRGNHPSLIWFGNFLVLYSIKYNLKKTTLFVSRSNSISKTP